MKESKPMTVQIPGLAVGAAKDNIDEPAVELLQKLSLLPTAPSELKKAGEFSAAFTGPPDSVTVIEAGATAAAKWWSVTIAGGAVVSGASIRGYWDGLGAANQPNALLALGLIFAAAGLGIAYLLGSDVRGRAAASVATIEARSSVAVSMLEEAGKAYRPASSQTASMPLNSVPVMNTAREAADEDGWQALAMRQNGDDIEFFLVKASAAEWVGNGTVKFK
jgi:hypothetical protein